MTDTPITDSDETPPEPMPSPADFLLRTPLYREYAADVGAAVKALQHWSGKVGALCPICGGGSILEGADYSGAFGQTSMYLNDRYFDVSVKCNWGHKEEMWFRFKIENKVIQKVGQWPSLADFALPEIARYRALLGKQRYADFSRAVRLAANGIGAGSFVYLRRVFEGLIAEARDEAKAAGELDEDAFARARMDERILLLRSRLPAFLVEHRGMYGILSVGVHELAEDQCLLYFDVVRKGIEAILEQHIEAERKAARLTEASNAVLKLQEELNRPKDSSPRLPQ
jgi:hypothetical protein